MAQLASRPEKATELEREFSKRLKKILGKFGAEAPLEFVVSNLKKTGVGFGLLTASSVRTPRHPEKRGTFGWRGLRIGTLVKKVAGKRLTTSKLVIGSRKRHGGRILVANHNCGSQAPSLGERGTSGVVACEPETLPRRLS